jgi:hypothetical protein
MNNTSTQQETLQLASLQKEFDATLKQYNQIILDSSTDSSFASPNSQIQKDLQFLNTRLLEISSNIQDELAKVDSLYQQNIDLEKNNHLLIDDIYKKLLQDKRELERIMRKQQNVEEEKENSDISVKQYYYIYLLWLLVTVIFVTIVVRMMFST